MNHQSARRKLLTRASALGIAGLAGVPTRAVAEPAPEVDRVRLAHWSAICTAPQYVAESLLRAEGFAEVEYVHGVYQTGEPFVSPGKADFDMDTAAMILTYADAGEPVVALAGVHLGCYELFGNERVSTIRDLKGKAVPIDGKFGSKHVLLSSMLAYVGLEPSRDIHWVDTSNDEGMKLFAQGKVDAFLGYPPEPQELRARKIGHVIVNTATDKPWSQYFCCILYSHRDFVRANPVATKRVVRAILKSADLCVESPVVAARLIVDRGFTGSYEYALETLTEVNYKVWRTYEPEDTLRFNALRLREVGMIRNTPQKLIERGTDWRFLNELKRELKA
jgi:NitT/TauT family transport system substrate-binding protein